MWLLSCFCYLFVCIAHLDSMYVKQWLAHGISKLNTQVCNKNVSYIDEYEYGKWFAKQLTVSQKIGKTTSTGLKPENYAKKLMRQFIFLPNNMTMRYPCDYLNVYS